MPAGGKHFNLCDVIWSVFNCFQMQLMSVNMFLGLWILLCPVSLVDCAYEVCPICLVHNVSHTISHLVTRACTVVALLCKPSSSTS